MSRTREELRGCGRVSQAWKLGSRYVLEHLVGAGSMGQVWSGHDVDGNLLAFKLLRSEFAEDPAVVARFLGERTHLMSIRSPYVIRVYDLVVEGPRIALVLDFVQGPSLREVLNRHGNLAPAQVATLGAQMAHGLAAVHQAGILHRDFKPENVLLAEIDGVTTPQLVDFGIASLSTRSGQGGTANVIGTPQYLAPELADARPASASSDLYALGVSLYEMACGIVPFSADSPLAVMRMQADHAAGRPAGIPDPLWDLIRHLMAKNPQQRPNNAAAVAAALEGMAPMLAGAPKPAPLQVSPPTTLLTATSEQPQAPMPPAEHPQMAAPINPAMNAEPHTGGQPRHTGGQAPQPIPHSVPQRPAPALLPGPATPRQSSSRAQSFLWVILALMIAVLVALLVWLFVLKDGLG